jgi:hypothetical protein
MRLFSTALDVKVSEALSHACIGGSGKNWDPLSQVASVSEFQWFEIKKILYFLARGVCEMPKLTEFESNACLPRRVAVSVIVMSTLHRILSFDNLARQDFRSVVIQLIRRESATVDMVSSSD